MVTDLGKGTVSKYIYIYDITADSSLLIEAVNKKNC